MSFIYSQALVAEYSQDTCSAIDAYAPSSGSLTPRPFLWHDKTMEVSRLSQFGMMCRPLMESHGAELLTLLLAGFRARTSVLQDAAQESPEQSPACGLTWRASLARFDQASSTWKTVQLCLLGDSELSSVIWPRSGMTRNGECWELPTLAHRTSATEFGYMLPTPSASDTSDRKVPDGFHTTKTGQFKHVSPSGEKSQMRLSQAVKIWATPTVHGNHNYKGCSSTSGDGLATQVRKFPTPTMRGLNGGSNSRNAAKRNGTWPTPLARDSRTVRGGARSMNALGSEPLITQVAEAENKTDGRLNPEWVEWLMGWPSGWTDLKPLETGKFQEWQLQHGDCLEASK